MFEGMGHSSLLIVKEWFWVGIAFYSQIKGNNKISFSITNPKLFENNICFLKYDKCIIFNQD